MKLSITRRIVFAVSGFVLFTAFSAAGMALFPGTATSIYFAAAALLAAAATLLDELTATLLGVASGSAALVLSLLFDRLLPTPAIAGLGQSFSPGQTGRTAALLICLLPHILLCFLPALTARLLRLIPRINPVLVAVPAALFGTAGFCAASWALHRAVFLSGTRLEQDALSLLLLRCLLTACLALVLALGLGLIELSLDSLKSRTVNIDFESEVPDLEPGAELAPFKRIPVKALLSEGYFNYDDFVYSPGMLLDVKLVIFDMDGLILDTERISCRSMTEVFRRHGATLTREMYMTVIGGARGVFDRLVADHLPGLSPDEALKESHAISRAYMAENGVPVKRGFFELARHLKSRGIRMAVGSSTPKAVAAAELAEAGALELFSAAVYGDEVENTKPAPDIFLKAARQCGVAPAAALVLEDSRNGILAAGAAGMRVVMIPDMIPPDDDLRARCLAVCDSLSDVVKML